MSLNFSGINNLVFISPLLSSFCLSFELFTVARELNSEREIRKEDKTKIGSLCYLLAVLLLFCFRIFTVGKDQNNFDGMKIPLFLALGFTKHTHTYTHPPALIVSDSAWRVGSMKDSNDICSEKYI